MKKLLFILLLSTSIAFSRGKIDGFYKEKGLASNLYFLFL